MKHPMERLEIGALRRIAVPAIAAVVLVAVGFGLAPSGDGVGDVIRLELAGSTSSAEDVMADWDERDRRNAAFGVGLDYLYMVAYAALIAAGCIWAGRVLGRPALGALGAWAAFLAAGLDAVENVGMLNLVRGDTESPWPQVAAVCAAPKFVLLTCCVILFLVAAVRRASPRGTE